MFDELEKAADKVTNIEVGPLWDTHFTIKKASLVSYDLSVRTDNGVQAKFFKFRIKKSQLLKLAEDAGL